MYGRPNRIDQTLISFNALQRFVFAQACARLGCPPAHMRLIFFSCFIVNSEIRLDNVRNEIIRVMSVLVQCTSQLQAQPYESRLKDLCNAVLAQGEDGDIEAALAHFKAEEPGGYGYEKLLAVAEDCAEAVVDERGSALLMLVPIMTWSRYRNYHGILDEDVLEQIADSIRTNFTSPKARVVMGSHMISADHLPEALREVRGLVERMRGLGHGDVLDISSQVREVPPPDFADSRYLVCCVAADKTEDLFHSIDDTLVAAARRMMNFCLQVRDILEFTMIGSVFEVQPAGGFYQSWRESETTMRAWGLKALVDFAGSMGYEPNQLIATLGLFVPNSRDNDKMSELRIGLTPKNERDHVICGIAWPVMPEETEAFASTARDILESKALNAIVEHEQSFSLEWCEDCGSPLYATPDGLVVHVELPSTENVASFAPTLN